MKTLQAKTDFGVKEINTINKPFYLFGKYFTLVDFPCKYLNDSDPMYMPKIIEVTTGILLPFSFQHKQTQKDMINQAINSITDIFKRFGETEFNNEFNKFEILNPAQ